MIEQFEGRMQDYCKGQAGQLGGCSISGGLGQTVRVESVSSKLEELLKELGASLNSSTRLANSLSGAIPETGAQVGPDSSDVLGKLSSLLRIARETNQQIERANQAVGN